VKRTLICAVVIVALALSAVAVAVAGIRHYHGSVNGGGTLRFLTKVHHGETIKVRRFVFNHVPMECDNGASTVGDVGTAPPPMRVNARHRFHGNFTSAAGRKHLHIDGRLKHHDRKAVGSLRVRGDFGGGSTHCDTGMDDWRAKRGGGSTP
jgi:hypothetical protein